MWLNILSLQWSVKQISWNGTSEHSIVYYDTQLNVTVVISVLLFVINWPQKTCVYQEYTNKVYRLVSFAAVILQRLTTLNVYIKVNFWIDKSVKYIFGQKML